MQIVTSVRNGGDAWEVIAREPYNGEVLDGPVYADDLGGEAGQEVLVELVNDEDRAIQQHETVTV